MRRAAAAKADVGTLPGWDLSDLYPGPGSDEVRRDLEQAAAAAEALHEEFAGRVGDLDGEILADLIARYEAIKETLERLTSYAYLVYCTAMDDAETAQFFQTVREETTDTESRLLPSVEGAGVNVLGVIPEDRTLLGITVAEIADYLGGRNITDVDEMDRLVEHFQVGGLGLDRGTDYFDLLERKAVVVRGDRPDIQMPALRTPMACMMLTMGIEPIEYVRYEAEQEEVPVMVVSTDTLATMEALDTLIDGARFDHPLKLERFTDLVRERIDVPALLGTPAGSG